MHVKMLALPPGGEGDQQLLKLVGTCMEAVSVLVRDSKANRYDCQSQW